MAAVRRFYALNIPFYIRCTAAGSIFKNLFRSGTLFFFKKKKTLHRKWFLKGGSALEVAFKKLFRYESEFKKIVLRRK